MGTTTCLSLVTFYSGFLRRTFTSAGLSLQSLDIDSQTTLSFWAPKPGLPTTEKPPLILIHGFGPVAIWQWRNQVKDLSHHYTLYVPDLVFFGQSITKSSDRSEIFQAVCVGKLLEKLGLKRYSVVGTSYGGFVTYHMARMWPERVEKVVIASSGVNMRQGDNVELMKRAKEDKIENLMLPETARQLRNLAGMAVFRMPHFVPEFVLDDIVRTLYSENRQEKKELLMGLTLGKDETVRLSPLSQDVLIVWGDQDQIFPLDKAHELKELLGKKVRLQVIKNTSHIPQIENARQFNAVVKQFLSGS